MVVYESKMMRLLDETVGDRFGSYALTFEAAMNSWCCDNHYVPYAIDVVVERPPFLTPKGWERRRSKAGDRYWECTPYGYITVRIWASLARKRYRAIPTVPNYPLDCTCVHPEFLLDVFELSPDIEFLWELRAYLAEVVHVDDMTDEQLMTFDRYVRLG